MDKLTYKINTGSIIASEIWPDATKDELRVLTYIIASEGVLGSVKELASICGISSARASSAISLWVDAGVLEKTHAQPQTEPNVTTEFEERVIGNGGVDEEGSCEVAREIRDGKLAELIADIASLLNRSTLSTQEIKRVTALVSQLALPTEYILTLAAYMSECGKLTPKRLSDTAARLVERGIDNIEALEKYIEDNTNHSGAEWEFRKLLGIWGRNLSKSEQVYFRRWSEEYGYSTGIVGIAYDITALNTGKASLSYMNKLLTAWHEAGCRTVADVEAQIERERETKRKEPPKKNGVGKKKATAETPLYGEFDSEDALMKALERSYGNSESEK